MAKTFWRRSDFIYMPTKKGNGSGNNGGGGGSQPPQTEFVLKTMGFSYTGNMAALHQYWISDGTYSQKKAKFGGGTEFPLYRANLGSSGYVYMLKPRTNYSIQNIVDYIYMSEQYYGELWYIPRTGGNAYRIKKNNAMLQAEKDPNGSAFSDNNNHTIYLHGYSSTGKQNLVDAESALYTQGIYNEGVYIDCYNSALFSDDDMKTLFNVLKNVTNTSTYYNDVTSIQTFNF